MRARQARAMLLIGAVLLAALAAPALAQGIGHAGPRLYGAAPFGPRPFGPWLWAAGLFFLLRVLLLVSLIVLAWRVIGAGTLWRRSDGARQLLRERYARGEIGDDEYRKRLGTLG